MPPFNVYSMVLVFGFFNFFLEMYAAQLLCMYKQKKRKLFPLRAVATAAVAIPFVFIPQLSIGPFSFSYLIVVAYLFVAALLCYKIKPLTALFYTVAAFCFQHLAWELLLILYEIVGTGISQAVGITLYIAVFAATYAAVFFIFPFRAERDISKKQRPAALAGSGLIILITFILSSIVPAVGGWTVTYRIYATVCCVCALCIQYGTLRRGALETRNEELARDKAVLEGLLSKERKQQEISKDTIEYINMKCHDLKHQVGVLRSLKGEAKEKSISEIEKAVMIYDKFVKTGNEALDIVLAEKGMLCEKHNVRFTCMADGERLSFMDPVDISSLFGNAVSNAFESVVQEEDEEKRFIRLNVSAHRKLLVIHVENYCPASVTFKDGLPQTSKDDRSEHGFGAKSIRYITEKYGGSSIMRQDGDVFNLDIVIPIPNTMEKAV